MSLSKRDQQVIWHPYTQMQTAKAPLAIERGEGAYLISDDGTRYLDGISSWWVNIHGHAHPYIAEKVNEQLHKLEHVIFAGFTHEPAVRLAERLIEILPGRPSKVFYSDNGSTAVEVALKMALQYWSNQGESHRNRIIAFKGAYHGDTFGAMSISDRNAFTKPFWPWLFEVEFVDVPIDGNESAFIEQIQLSLSKGNIAAFVFEPLLLGTAGMLMYGAKVLDEALSLCKAAGVICIADEVFTGFGRTGKLFASHYLEHAPDIYCLSKGLTGGTMALGATVCNQQIFDAFLSDDKLRMFFHGHSFTANPVACAAANASLDLLLTPERMADIERISQHHQQFAAKLSEYGHAQNVRCLGTVLAFECKDVDQRNYFSNLRDYIYQFFLDRQLILRPLGNTVYVLTPYCITNEQLEVIYGAIEALLKDLNQQ
ncbi:MAG: adenosylmethionine--8-amino-7-oxononanoate transaminase [Chitinophagales bacterium]|nr:adenosylmethionine--8-amino-7-oxononanoate transaminase [Chitinophagales bacterium]